MAETFDRPQIKELQSFVLTPQYIRHGTEDDRLAILVCRIKTWKAKNKQWFDIPTEDCLIIRECESIEITHSSRQLIGTAVLHFPRGTIIEKRLPNANVSVDSGNTDGSRVAKDVSTATANGDFVEYSMQQQKLGSTPTKEIPTQKELVSLDGTQVDAGLRQINQTLKEKILVHPTFRVIRQS